jgi:hypothetical protein
MRHPFAPPIVRLRVRPDDPRAVPERPLFAPSKTAAPCTWPGHLKMRTLLSVIVVALLTVIAVTEASARGRRTKQDATKIESSEKKKAAETAYQKALQRIPDSNEKPDPWKGIRAH